MSSLVLMPGLVRALRAVHLTPFAAALVACIAATGPLAAQTPESDVFDGLSEEMSAAEQASAGLVRLTPTERAFLDAWLRTRFDQLEREVVEVKAATAAEVDRRVAEERRVERAAEQAVAKDLPFDAEVLAPFNGWTGKTVFKLNNGQIWQQRQQGSYRHQAAGKQVRFEQNFLGGWEMTVIGTGRSVGVKRLK
jgi:hypothetical protein